VEKKEPITITHGDGHANVPITRFPWTPSPNLDAVREHSSTIRDGDSQAAVDPFWKETRLK